MLGKRNASDCVRVLAAGENMTRKVTEKGKINVNIRTIQRTVKEIGFKYGKAKRKIHLSKRHKEATLDCAK